MSKVNKGSLELSRQEKLKQQPDTREVLELRDKINDLAQTLQKVKKEFRQYLRKGQKKLGKQHLQQSAQELQESPFSQSDKFQERLKSIQAQIFQLVQNQGQIQSIRYQLVKDQLVELMTEIVKIYRLTYKLDTKHEDLLLSNQDFIIQKFLSYDNQLKQQKKLIGSTVQQIKAMKQRSEQHFTKLETQQTSFVSEFRNSFNTIVNMMTQFSLSQEAFKKEMMASQSAIKKEIVEDKKKQEDSLERKLQSMMTSIKQTEKNLQKKIKSSEINLCAKIKQPQQDLERKMKSSENQITLKITQLQSSLTSKIIQMNKASFSPFSSYKNNIQSWLKKQNQKFIALKGELTRNMEKIIQNDVKTKQQLQSINNKTRSLETEIEDQANKLQLAQKAFELKSTQISNQLLCYRQAALQSEE